MITVEDNDAFTLALKGHHEPGLAASAWYGGRVTEEFLPVYGSGSLDSNGEAEVQTTGTLYVADDANGKNLIPRSVTDPLAPFGQEVVVSRTVRLDRKVWTVPVGRFRITSVPDMEEFFRIWPSRKEQGWQVQLELADRFEALRADDFLQVTGPPPSGGGMVWDQVARLSPFPVLRTAFDAQVPASTEYTSRLSAITTLLSLINHVPHVTREGAITGRPKDRWLTATTPDFTVDGTIKWSNSMSNDVYNQVVVTASGNNDWVGIARITDPANPFAVQRMGGRTYRHSSPVYTSKDAVQAAAETILKRVSTRTSRTAQVVIVPDPRIELGDVGLFKDPRSGRSMLAEVSRINHSLNPQSAMTLEVVVAEAS